MQNNPEICSFTFQMVLIIWSQSFHIFSIKTLEWEVEGHILKLILKFIEIVDKYFQKQELDGTVDFSCKQQQHFQQCRQN